MNTLFQPLRWGGVLGDRPADLRLVVDNQDAIAYCVEVGNQAHVETKGEQKMLIRDLKGLSAEELSAFGCSVDGRPCRSVHYDGPGSNSYTLYFGSGDILSAKGHTRFQTLKFPRQARSDDRLPPFRVW